MLLSITGFTIIVLMVYLIFKEKASLLAVFIGLPVLGALINGFTPSQIVGFIVEGVGSVWQVAALYIFVITFFGIMSDTGMFDTIISRLLKLTGVNITMVFIVLAVVASLGHLDGSSPTTYLIIASTMVPLCKRLNIRMTSFMLVVASAIAVTNLVPWGGVVMRSAVALGVDTIYLYQKLLPTQIFGYVCVLILAFFVSRLEIKNGAGVLETPILQTSSAGQAETSLDSKEPDYRRPKLLWFNLLLTVGILAVLMTSKTPPYFVFMIGVVIALTVNYPISTAVQDARFNAHAPRVMMLVATTLAAGVLVGILNNTGMVEAMANTILHVLPQSLARYTHIIFGALGGFIGIGMHPDPYYYGLLPIIREVTSKFGISAESVAYCLIIGENSTFPLSPVIPTTFLGLAISGLTLKEHLKFSFLPLWIMGLLMLAFAVVTGLIQI